MQEGGVQYNTASDLWASEGINPTSSVNDVIRKLERDRIAKLTKPTVYRPPSPPPKPFVPPAPSPPASSPPAPTPASSPAAPAPTPAAPAQSPYISVGTQTDPVNTQYRFMQTPSVVKDIYLMSDPVRYNYLYDIGLRYIPSYYTYERRKRLEEAIKSAILKGLTLNKPQWEIEAIIKSIINDLDYATTTNINIEIPKKSRAPRKPSKKTSKKVKRASKKASKKTKKTSKKASKKPKKKSVKK